VTKVDLANVEGAGPRAVLCKGQPRPLMNTHYFPSALFVLGLALAAPAGAQFFSTASDYVPLKIIQTTRPVFPTRLKNSTLMEGEAWVVIKIDLEDQLEDWLVTGYTRKEFADEAVEALKEWKYETTRLRGQKWGTIREVHFLFSRTGVVISQTGMESIASYMEQLMPTGTAFRAYKLRELDRIPVPIKVVSPAYPKELAGKGVKGKVLVDFYVDETGKVRLPGALEWSNDVLANLAVTAVKEWQFEPPTYKGAPVLLQVSQEFAFGPK
jgi:TonB family protein